MSRGRRSVIVDVTELRSENPACDSLASEIWKNPELKYKKVIAAKLLTDYLKKNGHNVIPPYGGLQTAFLGNRLQTSMLPIASKHPTVAVLCEYDALPEMHNLIAEAGVGTIAATRAVDIRAVDSDLQGRVRDERIAKPEIVGSPAEEGGGGKFRLLHAGAFKDVHFAMRVIHHP
ncbi:hypothetical protein RvY_04986 [Ramazzottius varieornatus]|uniref:Uncharacterized protein n=1 Tax=Ramazzottius varieornatus TaxID=947166 RepID=A0A1D1UZ81_RAMVA|nr:hypothetical protein RvY_04986 [Ramazzottius varieornatus]